MRMFQILYITYLVQLVKKFMPTSLDVNPIPVNRNYFCVNMHNLDSECSKKHYANQICMTDYCEILCSGMMHSG